MRFPKFPIFAAACTLVMLLSGCSWLPVYLKEKAAINARYEKKEEQIERRYAAGQLSDDAYNEAYEVLYRQWDDELTVAKARAQGYEVTSSGGTTRKRRSSASTSSAANPTRFETQTTEYVGTSASDQRSGNAGTSATPAQPSR